MCQWADKANVNAGLNLNVQECKSSRIYRSLKHSNNHYVAKIPGTTESKQSPGIEVVDLKDQDAGQGSEIKHRRGT